MVKIFCQKGNSIDHRSKVKNQQQKSPRPRLLTSTKPSKMALVSFFAKHGTVGQRYDARSVICNKTSLG